MSCKIHHNETITAVLVNHIEAAKFSQAAWSRKEARNHDSVKQQNPTSTFINHVEAGKTIKKIKK